MDYLERKKELKELDELLKQEQEEDNEPDFVQYGFLKWKARE